MNDGGEQVITSDKVFKLVKNFERVLPYAQHDRALDMGEFRVSDAFSSHSCGTTHCHAGWYLLAKEWDLKSKALSRRTDYEDGVSMMAKDLGFETEGDLRWWATQNHKVWGNGHGDSIFCSSLAFNYTGKLTLQKIVDHWRKVGERLKILESMK